jgi:hypothetical protein
VPKREIFVTELFILSYPTWVCDLRTEPKNPFVLSVRLIFAIFFLPMTEYAGKIIAGILSVRYNLLPAYTEYAVIIIARILNVC